MGTLVSAIIATHDRPEKLRRAIRSVEGQTYSPIELIVVGSPKTPDVSQWVNESDVRKSKYIDAGATSPAAARNIGIEEANGQFLGFLDDDDEWLPNKTERQLARMRETNTGACHVGVRKISPTGVNAISKPTVEGDVTKNMLENQLYGTLSAMMVRRSLAQKIGGFDEEFTTCEDGDFNIRISLHTEFSTVPEPLVNKYVGDYNQVTDDVDTMKEDISLNLNKHRDLAREIGEKTEQKMAAKLRHGEGKSAASQGRYSQARRAFFTALRQDPSKIESWIWFLLVSLGPISYRTAQYSKRAIVRITNTS